MYRCLYDGSLTKEIQCYLEKGNDMDLIEILNLKHLKRQYQMEVFSLVDFTVGYDDNIYILFQKGTPESINGSLANSVIQIHYVALVVVYDWTSNTILHTSYYDFGILSFRYHFIRPSRSGFLLLGARSRYICKDHIEKNAMLLNCEGKFIREMCFGDGIEDCITTPEGNIIISYFDEGVFGNNGWDNGVGQYGLVVWNEVGEVIWQNKDYDICDCYAMNIDTYNRLWFYYHSDFELVCTDFISDVVFQPNIEGCKAFAISDNQKKILFSGGYNDNSFYLCDLDITKKKIGNKHRVTFSYDQREVNFKHFHFRGLRMLFLTDDDILCGYDLID